MALISRGGGKVGFRCECVCRHPSGFSLSLSLLLNLPDSVSPVNDNLSLEQKPSKSLLGSYYLFAHIQSCSE